MSAVGDARKRREEAVAAAFAPLVERQAQVEALVAAAERRGFERGAGVRGDVAAVALRVVREHQPTKWDASRGGWLDDLYCTCGVLIALGDIEAFGPEWEVHFAAALADALASDRDEQAGAPEAQGGLTEDEHEALDDLLAALPVTDAVLSGLRGHIHAAVERILAARHPETARDDSGTVAAVLAEVAADHIWIPKDVKASECWSANDRPCGLTFSTGGEHRTHLAEMQAAALSTGATAECDCYPGGFTPDTYEGPKEDCPVHGRTATRNEAVVKAEALREAADDWPLGSCAHRCFRTDPHTAPKDCLHGPDWLRDRAAALATGTAPGGGQDG